MKISISDARKLLSELASTMTDSEIESLIDALWKLAETADALKLQGKENE